MFAPSTLRKIGGLTLFAVSMAFMESAVVVYLRELYYPEGFSFPLVQADLLTYAVELGREAATLLMLFAVARLSGSSGWDRFACFAFLFGVWDIWYYVWLKVLLGWPASLLTWDVLFLIPVAWIGPVLAPVLVSLLLVSGSLKAMSNMDRGVPIRVFRWEWVAACGGAALVLFSFVDQTASALLTGGVEAVASFVPSSYGWPAFGTGYALMALAGLRILMRHR